MLIGRATFSAAVVLATELDRFTPAVFVGEPSGGRPNQYGEIETFTLPNSGLTVSYSSGYFQTGGPWDTRLWVTPELAVEQTSADFAAGRDPALDEALAYDVRQPALATWLIRMARKQGVDATLAAYRKYREDPLRRYAYTETALDELVVDLWRRGEVPASLPVALLVAEEYPGSFEAQENVAEIYADQGHPAEAVQYALASLRLHPGNGDALDVLGDVCGADVLRAYAAQGAATDAARAALRQACPAVRR